MARKPLEGSNIDNVLKYGTGAINIDGCRMRVMMQSIQILDLRDVGKKSKRQSDKRKYKIDSSTT